MQGKFRNLLLVLASSFFGLTFSLGSGVFAQREVVSDTLPWEDTRLLAEVLERVRHEYVEPVDDSALIESAVRGMVTDLDPHSQFLNRDEYQEIQISTTGNYSGIGLEVNMEEGVLRVIAAIEGAPAQLAGLMSGDVIVRIDDTDIDASNMESAVTKLRGKPGSVVNIAVRRDGEKDPLTYAIQRNNVQLRSVRYELLAPDYGYLRVTYFSESTWKDTSKAIQKLRQQSSNGLKGIILDLRDNPGGVLEAAVAVADGFLDEGTIVTASGRAQDANFSYTAKDGDLLEGKRIIVLVNQGSASAAEIVAGALQDNGRASIVGNRTFGKGTVQTVIPLSNGRAVKLTTSRYFTPSGASIQDQGVTPDIEIAANATDDLLADAAVHNATAGATILQNDAQLRRAFDVLQQERILQSRAQ
jgi:carboxyl-terminal processing protease